MINHIFICFMRLVLSGHDAYHRELYARVYRPVNYPIRSLVFTKPCNSDHVRIELTCVFVSAHIGMNSISGYLTQ